MVKKKKKGTAKKMSQRRNEKHFLHHRTLWELRIIKIGRWHWIFLRRFMWFQPSSKSFYRTLIQPRKTSPTEELYLKERAHWCLTNGLSDLPKTPWIWMFSDSSLFFLFPYSISLILLIHQLPGPLFFLNLGPKVNVLYPDCGHLYKFIRTHFP